MVISDLNWDEINEHKGLFTYKKYFGNGDSLRVFEFDPENINDNKKDPHRFKVICRFNNGLTEHPYLTEEEAYNECINFNLKEDNFNVKFRKKPGTPENKKALTYAKYITAKCNENKKPINNLSLQAGLYMLQKEYIRLHHERLFTDRIEAWKFGPCIPEVYYHYCCHGAMPIFGDVEMINIPSFIKEDPELNNLLNTIAEKMSNAYIWEYNRPEAWKLVYDNYGCFYDISKDFIEWEIKNGY